MTKLFRFFFCWFPLPRLSYLSWQRKLSWNTDIHRSTLHTCKKKDKNDKNNYKSISILSNISKVYRRRMEEQMNDYFVNLFFLFYLAFILSQSFTNQRTAGEGWGHFLNLTLHYHFHALHRHLDISQAITAESSPLHIGSSRTRTGNLWFPSASR